MNKSLPDLLQSASRVHAAQSAALATSQEAPRPGYLDRVLAAKQADQTEQAHWRWLLDWEHSLRWAAALSLLFASAAELTRDQSVAASVEVTLAEAATPWMDMPGVNEIGWGDL